MKLLSGLTAIGKNNNWSISETPVEIRPYNPGGFVIGGPVYPLFSITCNVCGHTLLFNAIVAGLVPSENAPPPAPQPQQVPPPKEQGTQ